MSSVLTLDEQYNNANQHIEEITNDTELNQNIFNQLFSVNDDFENKVVNFMKIIKTIESNVKLICLEIKRLQERKSIKLKTIEWLKSNIISSMQKMNITKLETATMSVSLKNNPPSCHILDENAIPETFKELEISTKIDKRKILEHVKATGDVPVGVEIRVDQSLYCR